MPRSTGLLWVGEYSVISSSFITWNVFIKRCFPTSMIRLICGNVHTEKGKQIFEFFPLFTNVQDNEVVSYLPVITFKYHELMDSNIFDRFSSILNIIKTQIASSLFVGHLISHFWVLLKASLLSHMTKYSRFNVYVSCPKPGISHFSKKPDYF